MSPAHHKAYKKNAAPTTDVTENMALLLEQAASHMSAVVEAIASHDVEKRFKESERAAFILGGLKGALVRVTPEQSQTADALQSFYENMETLIMRVNVFNNAHSAVSIAQNLSKMAGEWRRIGAVRRQESLSQVPTSSQETFYTNV